MTVDIGELEVSYSARGIASYRLEMWHHGLKKHRVIKGNDTSVIQRKAELQALDWVEKWERAEEREAQRQAKEDEKELAEQKKQRAERRTQSAEADLSALDCLLAATLDVDDTIDWDQLKSTTAFNEAKPLAAKQPDSPTPKELPLEPDRSAFAPQIGLLDRVIQFAEGGKAF